MTSPLLFLVPARGGSRRLPGKNLELVAGIPLVGHAVRLARRSARLAPGGPHAVVCSTDDGPIAAAARAWGADVLHRPQALATDDATSAAVALHALDALGRAARGLVLLQPTSALTEVDDVLGAIAAFDASGGRQTVAVTTTHPARWHLVDDGGSIRLDAGPDVKPDAPSTRVPTGAIYVIAPGDLRRDQRFLAGDVQPLTVPAERSIDIDEPADLAIARALVASREVRSFDVAGHRIGGTVFVIAEGGVNHDGRPDLAHRLIDAAAAAGADAVKFQTFDPAALVAAGAPRAEYQRRAAGGADDDQRSMLARLALPRDAWERLRDHAAERGLVFLSTPFDDASAELLDGLGIPAFKVGSGELTNLPFLARLAQRGHPLLISTGMADMVEVADAVDAISAAGNPPVALFHCVSSYPARPEDANLRAIRTLRAAFGVPVGWSDHTPGVELPIAAVAAGATLIEKHLTLDRAAAGPDHAASLEPDGFAAMVSGVRIAESALGSGDKRPVAAELPIAAVARKSLHWASDRPRGHVIAASDLVALRPGTGLRPALADGLVGRRAKRDVAAGTMVEPGDLDGEA